MTVDTFVLEAFRHALESGGRVVWEERTIRGGPFGAVARLRLWTAKAPSRKRS